MVAGSTDTGGVLLRTLYVLRPGLARFSWVHAQLACEGLTSEAARRHHNYWHILWTPREGAQSFLDAHNRRLASYPTLRFGCERYLLRLEARCPQAWVAESIAQFVAGLVNWEADSPDYRPLVTLFESAWPHPDFGRSER
ncbi:MAG: hypothetical protein KME03_09720 [Aphanocapsa lilacina HA4352-LM1]|nr:hypothetical protein [Aphanocapsa lilacina HA4352-LM1]